MDLINDRISGEGQSALHLATHIQLVHSPALDTRFYQWLLIQARAGVKVEVLVAGRDGLRHADLTPSYFLRLEAAGGRIFLLPDDSSLPAVILLDNTKLLQLDKHQHPAMRHYILEENAPLIQKVKRLFDQWKERGIIAAESNESAHHIDIVFQATPQSVEIHEHFELTWQVSGADKITIEPLLGQVSEKGRQILSAEKTTEFCLTASNVRHTVSSIVNVSVNPQPKIEYLLTANGQTEKEDLLLQSQPDHPDHFGIVKGQVLNLYWRVYNADKISLDGQEVGPTGHQILTPDQMRSYTLAASGQYGIARKSIIVDVFARPEIQQLAIAAPVLVNSTVLLPSSQSQNPLAPNIQSSATATTERTNAVSTPAFKFSFVEFFWFCSGASRQILRRCPSAEGNKYAGIGATVFFTGLLAALSGGYALFMAFQNHLMALLFGLLWGTAIFNLDRLIVSTIKKDAGLAHQWLQAIPRFLLALVLSIVIAKPLELRVFKPEIDEILAEKRVAKLNTTESMFQEKATSIEKYIDKIKAETAVRLQAREMMYQEYRCECDGTCGTGKLGRGSECARKEAKYRQVASEYEQLKSDNDQLVEKARTDLLELKKQEIVSLREVEAVFADGFMARLNAAQDLPFLPSFFIALLIFMIEIAPVLSKILAPKGAYDEAARIEEARFGIQEDGQLRQHQDLSAQESNLQVELHQVEMDEALQHKREILRIIAGAQVQLVQEKVDLWLEEERKRLRTGDGNTPKH